MDKAKVGDIFIIKGVEEPVVGIYRNSGELAFQDHTGNALSDYPFTSIKEVDEKMKLSDKVRWYMPNSSSIIPTGRNIKDKKMSNFIDQTKGDLSQAAWRVGGTQTVRLLKKVILSLLKKEGFNKRAELNTVERFLSTKIGEAFISMCAGQFLTFFPKFKDMEKVQKLAGELRISGFATAGNELVDFIQDNYIGDLMNVVNALPSIGEEAPKKIRINHPAKETFSADLPDPSEGEELAEKKMTAL